MGQPIRVLIADNDPDFSKGLEDFLEQQEDIEIVGVIRDGQSILDSCQETSPDLILMDLHLPILDSVTAIQGVVAVNDDIRILTTSATPNDPDALEAVKAGASGYIEKKDDINHEVMAKTIRQVASGDVSLSPALAASILKEFHKSTVQD